VSTRAIDYHAPASRPPRRLNASRIVLGQFVVVIVLLALWVLLGKFLGARAALAFAVVGMPLLALSTLGVMAWAAWGIRRQKVALLLLAVVADAGFISGSDALSRTGDRLFFATRRSRLETFARDIVSYGRIHQMSDGLRAFTELNGELVAASPSEAATALTAASRRHPLGEVLARDAITAERYEEFQRRLRDLALTQFDAQPGYVAFLYDGMLDNLEGYLLVKPGGSPPARRSTLFGASLVRLEPIGDGWYRFVTN
jgi:hypothetical protein